MYDTMYELHAKGLNWKEDEVEKAIANSSLVIILLSKESLKEPGVIFAMECLLHKDYEKRVQPVIVHGKHFFKNR
jgi:hypothetical protein